jgi:carbamoyl-phosphate synthase small subunit
MRKAYLVLEDGSYFIGKAFGKLDNKAFGEIVFNTGMTGYQEVLTDPSYAGQIITLTYTEIGNYGINLTDNQSRKIFASGFIVKNISPLISSWRAVDGDLNSFLQKYQISGLYGIDTRALTRKIRSLGAMRSVISTENYPELNSDLSEQEIIKQLLEEVKQSKQMSGLDLASEVSTEKAYTRPYDKYLSSSNFAKNTQKNAEMHKKPCAKVTVLDFGLKDEMLNLLNKQGIDLEIIPANSSFEQIMQTKPNGIFLSNGPGDPEACTSIIETVKKLIDYVSSKTNEDSYIPLFGVCLGHQILSLASGAETFKLKFGHRGSNHPVKDLLSGKSFITSQNHGFAVKEESLPLNKIRITHKSLNDGTIEGFEYIDKPIFAVQFHPEASPGTHDTNYLFDKFTSLITKSSN